jgi:achilleol B synthase
MKFRSEASFLLHTGRFWCFTRITYRSIAFLYAKRFVGPITATILALRNELYNLPYDQIDWTKEGNTCAKVCPYPSIISSNIH